MTRLLHAEVLRFSSRRLTWVLVVCTALLAVVLTLVLAGQVRYPSEWEREMAQVYYQQYLDQYEPGGICDVDPEVCGSPRDESQTVNDWLRTPATYEQYLMAVIGSGTLAVIAATVLASAFVGAEFATGSIGTQLTFTPRRGRVMGAKVLVATTGGFLLGILYAVVALLVGTITFVMLRGATDVLASQVLLTNLGRLLLVALLLPLLAASLTFAVGSTGLAIGAGTLALVVSELLVTASYNGALPVWLLRLLPSKNLMAMAFDDQQLAVSGTEADPVIEWLTFSDSVIYGTVLIAVVTLIGFLVFRRRDLLR